MIKINESMKVKYHSNRSGTMKEIELSDQEVEDLKRDYNNDKNFLSKKGIKNFDDYVQLILSFNN